MTSLQKQKLVFWDWTGTLADEFKLDEAVCKSMTEEIAKKNDITFKEADKIFVDYLTKLEKTWKWHDYVLFGTKFGIDWKKYQELHLQKLFLFPYAREILEYVRKCGYKNVLATNAVRAVILLRVNYTGLSDLFDLTIACDDVKALKSEGKHFKYGLRLLNGNLECSLSVGDNPVQDIMSARRLGLRTIF